MAPTTNTSVILNSIPSGHLIPNETLICKKSTIDLKNVSLSGGILIKTLYLSIDPYLRGKMRAPDPKLYETSYRLGEPIWGYAVVSVVRSEKEDVYPEDILYVVYCPFEEYTIIPPNSQFSKIQTDPDISLSALANLGETAFYGLEVVAKPVKGETIYVSSGASAVGSLTAQLAKAKGLKVIASAGSDDKVAFMKSIGVDVAFNYKTESIADILHKEGPIDIYWDNVGGPTLDAALGACAMRGRVVICGVISQYTAKEPYGIKNTPQILYKQLRVEGFFVTHARQKYEGAKSVGHRVKFFETVLPLVKSGKVKWTEHVFNGIESVGEGMIAVLTSASTAKVVIKVADA
ncbi:hypothetical protein CTheo_6336 [Ceratobasidium theobromae]|uniref:Enoyl reductase (ER) domain-containing protein n=1 Tax=Ceratobasidium theobromae TaxID=1582974 RepID=A0A5N5QFC9_9AGAM|nr:hypothetical protein CTheo_6336 [Ceratobasidium theobromae]